MTDRHAGYIVVLHDAIREDDAEAILTALRMVKGVLSVEPIVNTPHVQIAATQVNHHWRNLLTKLIEESY